MVRPGGRGCANGPRSRYHRLETDHDVGVSGNGAFEVEHGQATQDGFAPRRRRWERREEVPMSAVANADEGLGSAKTLAPMQEAGL